MDEAEWDMKNSADRGRWITPSSICRILHILGKPNSIIIVFLLIQNISKFKSRLKHATVLLKSKLMLETRDSSFASWSSNASSFRMRGSRCLEFRSSRIQKARFSERMMLYDLSYMYSVCSLCSPRSKIFRFARQVILWIKLVVVLCKSWWRLRHLSC